LLCRHRAALRLYRPQVFQSVDVRVDRLMPGPLPARLAGTKSLSANAQPTHPTQRLAKREKRPVGHDSRTPAAGFVGHLLAVKLVLLPDELAGGWREKRPEAIVIRSRRCHQPARRSREARRLGPPKRGGESVDDYGDDYD
jgi:hypothetical protein